jgi:isocitrate dehydrogenase (NAD+)
MFEAVHGSAPDIAGQGIANPCALFLAIAQMLDHLERPEEARRLRAAIRETISAGDRVTPDLGGTGTTASLTDAVLDRLSG